MNEVKRNIVRKAAELFNQVGIRSCSIDDICRELGMSKKTFYQYFETKDELVEELLKSHEQHARDCADNGEKSGIPAMQVMLRLLDSTRKMKDVRQVPPLLYDLRKYYPQQFSAHISALAKINKEKLLRLLQNGINEGDFRADLNVEHCATFFSELNQQALNNLNQLAQMENFAEFSVFAVDLLIRGIVSEQGLRKLKNED